MVLLQLMMVGMVLLQLMMVRMRIRDGARARVKAKVMASRCCQVLTNQHTLSPQTQPGADRDQGVPEPESQVTNAMRAQLPPDLVARYGLVFLICSVVWQMGIWEGIDAIRAQV